MSVPSRSVWKEHAEELDATSFDEIALLLSSETAITNAVVAGDHVGKRCRDEKIVCHSAIRCVRDRANQRQDDMDHQLPQWRDEVLGAVLRAE